MIESLLRPLIRRSHDSSIHSLFVLLAVTLVGLLVFLGGGFFNADNLSSMAAQIPELGILALGMAITLLAGGINLAVVATADLAAITTAFLITRLMPSTGSASMIGVALLAILAGLAVSLLVGLVNGLLIAYIGVSPILATLGTMTLVKGIAVGLTHGGVISGFPRPFLFIGNGAIAGIPVPIIIFVVCAVALSVTLTRTAFGISVYMTGSNEAATRYAGIRTKRVLIKVYILSGFFSGTAALVMMARFNSANASYGESYLLVTILAAVLGGIDPFGGSGRVMGLVLALVILQLIASGLNVLGLSSYLTLAIWGIVLITVAAIGLLKSRFHNRARRVSAPSPLRSGQ